ncbi:hypothetical protein AHF37_01322 [Paragonimus kellicotti]|nr:hypothetical protein AHF37_01322 [Paragonimus kellicotti]
MHPYLDRHTTAQRRFCVSKSIPLAHEQVYQRICPDGLPHGSVFFDRSINGQCTQNKNSFYCTSNTPIVNRLFGEQIVERQSYLKDTHCDTQRRLCQTCLWRSCGINKRNIFGPKRMVLNSLGNEAGDGSEWITEHKDKYRNDEASSCCGVECYLSPSCLDYFSATCQAHTINHPETEEVCLQGTTLKFTLNPEFDFANDSYMCHLRYNPPRSLYTVRSWLSIKNTWQTGEISFEIGSHNKFQTMPNKLLSRRYSERSLNLSGMQNALQTDGRVLLWDQNVQIIYESKVQIWKDAILKQEGNSEHLKLFKLKTSSEFSLQPPEIQRHREDKYLTVQFEKPFLHNTESWGNQSCQINVSHFHKSQPIYREDGGVSVSLAAPIEKDPDGAFRYKFDDSVRSTIVQLSTNMGLSLVLSLESNAARQFTAALYHFGLRHSVITSVNAKYPGLSSNLVGSIINSKELETQWQATKPWMIEAARMEDFAQSELLRQVRN